MSDRGDELLVGLVTLQDMGLYLLVGRTLRTTGSCVYPSHRFVGAHLIGLLKQARRW